MVTIRHLLPLGVALMLQCGAATAQLGGWPSFTDDANTDWVAYRDAYQSMIPFEKYGKPKQFLQSHYRIAPRDKGTPIEGLRLNLVGKTTNANLPLDGIGRVVFPLSKSAFDENAELRLNRKPGLFWFRPCISIVGRADGVYQTADLRTACDQALHYLQYVGADWVRGKQCTGVQFVYARTDADPDVKLRKADQPLESMPVTLGAAFAGDAVTSYKLVVYRFTDAAEAGQIITHTAPLVIAPVMGNLP